MNINKIISEEVQNLFEQVDDLAISLFNLIKYNGGYFKSEKQKDFFLNKLKKQQQKAEKHGFSGRNGFVTSGEVYGNTYTNTFYFDDKGITEVIKHTKKGGDVVTWERSEENTLKSQDNQIHRDFIKATKKYYQKILNDRDVLKNNFEKIKNNKISELSQKYSSIYNDMITSFYESIIERNSNEIQNDMNNLENKIKSVPEKSKPILEILIELREFIIDSREKKLIPLEGGEEFYVNRNPIIHSLLSKYNTPEKKKEFIKMMNTD